MTTRTWVGGGNNNASNAADWNPNGAPAGGDALSLAAASATMNIAGSDLAGDTLAVTGTNDTANLSNTTATITVQNVTTGFSGALTDATLNLSGTDTLILSELQGNNPKYMDLMGGDGGDGGSSTTINLDNNTTWNGTFNVNRSQDVHNGFLGSHLTVNGPASSSFNNNGSSVVGDGVVINTNVTGSGSFSFTGGPVTTNTSLEFGDSVGANQTVTLDNLSPNQQLLIDKPQQFAGHVEFDGGTIDLKNLGNVDSYTYDGNTLSLIANGSTVDTLNLTTTKPLPLPISKSGSDVFVGVAQPALPVAPVNPPDNFTVTDTSDNPPVTTEEAGDAYNGPVPGITRDIILANSDNINVTSHIPNVFIKTGSGEDALNVQAAGGNNVLDGSTGSNFMVGGNGNDTFFVDDRTPPADIWSSVAGFHAGDSATVFGVTQNDFSLNWVDGQGAQGFTGLTLHATKANQPDALLTLAGYTTADLNNGRLGISFGSEQDGTPYMLIQGH